MDKKWKAVGISMLTFVLQMGVVLFAYLRLTKDLAALSVIAVFVGIIVSMVRAIPRMTPKQSAITGYSIACTFLLAMTMGTGSSLSLPTLFAVAAVFLVVVTFCDAYDLVAESNWRESFLDIHVILFLPQILIISAFVVLVFF